METKLKFVGLSIIVTAILQLINCLVTSEILHWMLPFLAGCLTIGILQISDEV